MYRLTNLTLDLTTTYKNKDLIYQALERENARVKHQEAEGILLVEEVDKKGIVIAQEDIYLPFEGIADSLFLNKWATTTPEPPSKKKNSFLKRSKSVIEQESSSNEKQGLRAPLSDKETPVNKASSRPSSLFKVLGRMLVTVSLLGSLALATTATSLVVKQEKELEDLSQQVKQLKSLQSETGKLDTFARYFLPYYYSEQGKLDDFVSSNLELKHPAGQLQSVILESTTKAGDQTYHLTYVLAIKDGETRKQKRLLLTLKAVPSAPYGYQVIKAPKQTAYLK